MKKPKKVKVPAKLEPTKLEGVKPMMWGGKKGGKKSC